MSWGGVPRQGPGRGHVGREKGRRDDDGHHLAPVFRSTREHFQICPDDPGKPVHNIKIL